MTSRSQRDKRQMPKPESGGKPKKIVGKTSPGGPHTPGEKAKSRLKGKGKKS